MASDGPDKYHHNIKLTVMDESGEGLPLLEEEGPPTLSHT